MVTTHNLGFPRIGRNRELKFALEKYWQGAISEQALLGTTQDLQTKHWREQSRLDWITVGDFSLYDHVLDTSFLLGNIPARVSALPGGMLDHYFRVARGRSVSDHADCACVSAGEMTKWFDTNYHYIVPEFARDTRFSLDASRLLEQIRQAQQIHPHVKPAILGPVTYLWLGKSKDGSNKLELLDHVLDVYVQLLLELKSAGIQWIQVDEPVLVMELDEEWKHALRKTYYQLQAVPVKLLLTTYFGQLQDNLQLACELPVAGLHLDAVAAHDEIAKVIDWLPTHKILSLGAVNGRNIWKTDLTAVLDWLEPVRVRLQERLWLATSCSLLHVPVDLESEQKLDPNIRSWLAFAVQKLREIDILAQALNHGRKSVLEMLRENSIAITSRKQSKRVHHATVKARVLEITNAMGARQSPYYQRAVMQREKFQLPLFSHHNHWVFSTNAANQANTPRFS